MLRDGVRERRRGETSEELEQETDAARYFGTISVGEYGVQGGTKYDTVAKKLHPRRQKYIKP